MALDPTDHTVDELEEAIEDVEDAEELEAVLDAEKEGDDRKTAKEAVESRLDEVRDDPSDAEDESGADSGDEEPEEDDGLDHPTEDKRHVRALEGGDYRDMWVYCETQQGELLDVSKEMLGKARQLMDKYNEDYDEDEKVVAVLVGDDVEGLAEEAISLGADVATYYEDDRFERFELKPYTEVFCDLARGAGHPHGREDKQAYDWHGYDEPRYTLFPATNNGRDLSATVQGELDSGLASDCSGLTIETTEISNPAKTGEPGTKKTVERVLHMKRPDFSGFEYSTILCIDKPDRDFHPQGGSVIPGSFDLPEPDPDREGVIVEHEMPLEETWLDVDVTDWDQLEGGVDLSGNDVVVALGRGIGDDPTKGIELGVDLVDQFDEADLGLSRGVITASYEFGGHVEQYVTLERQIGESGQVVEPDLYIAAGISGAVQHKVGCDESDTILAINNNPDADIRDWSDYFIEGDLFDVLPMLIESLESGELDATALADGGVADE